MSIAELATGDTVVKQTKSQDSDTSFRTDRTFTDGDSVDCLVQTVSSNESLKYQARGQIFTHEVFFSSDPSLSNGIRLKWTVQAGVTLATALFMRVLNVYSEGRPGEDMLWIAECEQETTRREP